MSAAICELSPVTTRPRADESELLSLIRRAAGTGDEIEIAKLLKSGLVEMAKTAKLDELNYPAPRNDRYARHLLYSDPWGRFVVIAMTWAAGQGTPLHDHAGVWCVEVVVDGEMQVTNYQLCEERIPNQCRFERRETIPAPPASSGALIPPFEHHVFSNVGSEPSHTLHVYGGPMNCCDIFQPLADGWYQRQHRLLRYDG